CDPVVELETDKVNVEVNSDYAGVIVEVLAEEGDDVSVGDTIAKVDESGEGAAPAPAPAAEEKQEEAAPAKEEAPAAAEVDEVVETDAGDVIASPAARKLAREKGIDLSQVKPQDPLGRIRPEDVEAADKAAKSAPAPAAKQAPSTDKTAEFNKPVRVEKM